MTEYHGGSHDGFLTDVPISAKLSSDGIEVRYDVQLMRWIPNRLSGIVYPKAKKLIKQYRRKYAEKIV